MSKKGGSTAKLSRKSLNIKHILKRILIVFSLINLTLFFILGNVALFKNLTQRQEKNSLYSSTDYRMVFMNNNLFYFCKLTDFNDEFIACNDPYYLVREYEKDADGNQQEKVYVKKPADQEIAMPEGAIYLKKDNIVYITKIGENSPVMEVVNDK